MKRILVALSVIGILCSLLLTGISVFAEGEQYVLDFAPVDMVYDTANGVWAKAVGDLSAAHYEGISVVDVNGAAAIRKFVAPTAGALKLAWGNVRIDNGQGNLTGSTVQFAVTDGDGKILFPTNGDVATVAEGTPLDVALDIESIAAGDEFYFVVMNPTVDRMVCVLNFAVIVDGVAYSNSNGFLYGDSTQGTGGWYYQYAETVTKTTASDAASKPVAFEFTEKELGYLPDYGAWGADDYILTGTWSNWGYVDQTYTSIRKLVMPKTGTFKIETIWGTTGVTVQNAADSFDFAILNKDKEIVWPTNGGWFKVTGSTPAEVNLEMPVQAGDAVYFLFKNGSAVPTPYTTASVLCIDNYETRLDNGSGGYGAADITAQGNGGWYYLYASDLTAITAEDRRDLTALNTALTAAAALTDLSGYTDDSVAAFQAALTAAQAITDSNTQAEIDAAAAALTAAIAGLTAKPEPEPQLPPEDPANPTVALQFTEQLMTYDATLTGWTADADNNCVIYPWASVSPKQNGKVAIRKFVAPAAGDLILAWGTGISVDKGSANFVITDKYGKIVYPQDGGKITLTAGVPHELNTIFEDIAVGDTFYFVVYNHTVDGAVTSMHSAVNIDSTAYAENGNFANSANTQGAGGWYYLFATDLTEVKFSEYKTFVALNEQIALADSIPADTLALFSEQSVAAFETALATAKALTEENTQAEIDAATAALAAAIKALAPKATPDDVTKVTFTAQEMTFNPATGYWHAADDPSCVLTEPLNYPTPVTTTNLALIRKLVLPADGTLTLKWGNGVYIDNTSGLYDGATVEFAIADKNGNILYPQDGGVAVITEGTPLVLDVELTNMKKGDELYFLTFNPSMANVPVVYNVGVTLNGATALQTSGGFLYGSANAQGNTWYYYYADDLTFSKADADDDNDQDEDKNDNTPDNGANSPATGDKNLLWIPLLVTALAAFVLLRKPQSAKEK